MRRIERMIQGLLAQRDQLALALTLAPTSVHAEVRGERRVDLGPAQRDFILPGCAR